MRALRQNALGVAKNAFERLKDIKYLSFIENLQRDFEGGMTSALRVREECSQVVRSGQAGLR